MATEGAGALPAPFDVPGPEPTMSDFVLEATGVAKSYGAVRALVDASLSVRPGEVHALLGANGAGKSTLVKVLTGVISADHGTVEVNGATVRIGSPARAARI